MSRLTSILALYSVAGGGADWLNRGGDPQQSNWQKRENTITPANVHDLKLIWKRQLAGRAFSSPLILGHVVTHRGTVELVIVFTASGDLYAIDGDFGTVFWKRHLDGYRPSACQQKGVPTPAAAAPPNLDEEDDDAPQPLRPIYALGTDGRLHSINPGLGTDLAAWDFLPSNAQATDLLLQEGSLVTVTLPGCGQRVTTQWSLATADVATKSPHSKSGATEPSTPLRASTCQTSSLDCWIYEIQGGRLVAFEIRSQVRKVVWTSKPLSFSASPVVGGGLVFALAGGDPRHRAILYALDAATGRLCFSSGTAIRDFVRSGSLALANGHVCFVSASGMLYCFGFPVDV